MPLITRQTNTTPPISPANMTFKNQMPIVDAKSCFTGTRRHPNLVIPNGNPTTIHSHKKLQPSSDTYTVRNTLARTIATAIGSTTSVTKITTFLFMFVTSIILYINCGLSDKRTSLSMASIFSFTVLLHTHSYLSTVYSVLLLPLLHP